MCGITGYKKRSKSAPNLTDSLVSAIQTLRQRGPDHSATFIDKSTGLGHTRLSIIDTSNLANQPMTDHTGRYTLVFNGEIYNYQELKSSISFTDFRSTSDTEVLLYLLIEKGKECLQDLNGFFAFAFYDAEEETLLLARDRMGIKPLHYFDGEDFFAFGSEMKALLSYPIPRKIDHNSLYWYMRLTYLPYDKSMISGVKKLLPGHYLYLQEDSIQMQSYWKLTPVEQKTLTYQQAKDQVVILLEQSVQRRMVADVPLGAFLSGGTDSSAVVSMASKFNNNLNTFSIGYKDHSFFDETHYAELVAEKFNTNHTTFSLTNDDLINSLQDVVDYIDEPFADSSAIPTYILSKHVAQSMKVALSGDGADELFGGYYKHLAFQRAGEKTLPNQVIKLLVPLLQRLPTSRSSQIGNLTRRAAKYSELMKMDQKDKYWFLASFNPLAHEFILEGPDNEEIESLQHVHNELINLNDFLDLDLGLVLSGDMLTKVDLMSMANSLEVRVPFLDKDLVAFARSLPPHFKVDKNRRKTVLQDAFEHILPKELHHRTKKGFEVPMLSWMRNELSEEINKVVFDMDFLENQKIFKTERILDLRNQLHSNNPGDVHAILWSVYVFQKWYMKTISENQK